MPPTKTFDAARLVDLLDISAATDVLMITNPDNSVRFLHPADATQLRALHRVIAGTTVHDQDGNVRDNPASRITFNDSVLHSGLHNLQELLENLNPVPADIGIRDLDVLITPGAYIQGSKSAAGIATNNYPLPAAGTLTVASVGPDILQIYNSPDSGGAIYVRTQTTTGWTAWKQASFSDTAARVFISENPPATPQDRDIWFDSTSCDLMIYYDDGSGTPSAQWVVVSTGKVGVDGPTGPTGAQGVPGPAGPSVPGPAGITGATGPTGAIGIPGPGGPQGNQGIPGNAGITGLHGDPGVTGAIGPEGPIGPIGPQGLVGAKGDMGPGITIEGSDTWAHISTKAGMTSGQMWVLTTDDPTAPDSSRSAGTGGNIGDGIIWDGSTWINAGPIEGRQGDPGIHGSQGGRGPAGATGPDGPRGLTGHIGPIGTPGPVTAAIVDMDQGRF